MLTGLRARWHSSITLRLVLGFCVLMAFTVVLLVSIIGTMMRPRMDRSTDLALRAQARIFQTAIQNEEDFLLHEAFTIANLEGISVVLATKDPSQLDHLLFPVLTSHDLTSVYIIDEDRHVLYLSGEPMSDPAAIGQMPLVERGFDLVALSAPLESCDALWLTAAVTHRSHDRARAGRADALVLVAKRLDRQYLQTFRDTQDVNLALALGNTASYACATAPMEIPLGLLRPSDKVEAEYQEGPVTYRGIQVNGVSYRVAALTFSTRDGTPLTAFVYQSTASQTESLAIAIAQVVGISFGVTVLGVLFAFLYARGVTRPLTRLAHAARIIANGNLERPVRTESRDEVGELAASFEEMRVRVRGMLEAQQRWNADLEDKVREKTLELQALCEIHDQLLQYMLNAKEEEARRVARELHDETSQALTALIANLAAAQMLEPAAAHARLKELKAATVVILKEINRIVLDLRPTLLDDYGLIPALSWYSKDRLESSGIEVTVSVNDAEMRLQPHVETTLFRVGQEAVNNIAKHSGAKRAMIDFHFPEEEENPIVTLRIEDDGCGFQIDRVNGTPPGQRPHLGLFGMQERLSQIGGRLEIRSAPGKGTCICATAPVWQCSREIGRSP